MRAIVVPFLLLALVPHPIAAEACTPTTSQPELDTGEHGIGARYYVDNDLIWMSIWIYEESNGIDGLQRSDETFDGTCDGMIPSDTIIF